MAFTSVVHKIKKKLLNWYKKDLDTNPSELFKKVHGQSYAMLLWKGFKGNKLALLGLILLLIMFICSILAPLFSPNGENYRELSRKYAPPAKIHLFDDEGKYYGLFVYDYTLETDALSGKRTYKPDKNTILPIRFFIKTEQYHLFNLILLNRKLFGAVGGIWYPFGGDHQGRCVFSRIIFASRISLSIALFGATLTVVFGTFLGTISGYFGGIIDTVLQRLIEIVISFPRIPLWMALAAALPAGFSPVKEFFLISLVLSVLGWGGLARQIRGVVLSLRDSDFVLAAKSYATPNKRIMFKHILPNILGVIIVNATILIPLMIIGETSLSFLGLGLRPPANSWGVLLKDAQAIQALEKYPWLLIPGIFVVVSILSFNFIGDGLRDAVDPYKY